MKQSVQFVKPRNSRIYPVNLYILENNEVLLIKMMNYFKQFIFY